MDPDELPADDLAEAGEEQVAVPDADQEPAIDRQWYVIHTYSGYENKVRKNLEHRIETMGMQDSIFEVVVPIEEEVEMRSGKRVTLQRKIFPGYVLVNMSLNDESWHVVRHTPGVTGFVGSGNKPVPLGEQEVQSILKRMEDDSPKIKVSFVIGQSVKIIEGPFADFTGSVDEINAEKGKLKVLVSFFGRETPIELDFLQVERI
ncbi:MAG: transcription termination/antitermination protein NusG [Chloroflexi bacterium]|nr:transcription termination/antitermination protein NusG [Chloroflexota bacterium]MBU1749041.1 transcription termination/antitermination protein NusG [Chloroflexota bacterium]MBU1878244.1 transcription termination/antitermination protein NusG [Chloroflexota bacterium]